MQGLKRTLGSHIRRYVVSLFIMLSVIFPLVGASNAYAQPAAGSTDVTCAVEKVGWFVCPIVERSAWVADLLFKLLANLFLQTEPELVSSDPNNGTVTAWESARNIANVMFIIAFIIIVYSQVTGSGLNNYGIKKMLPRLIVAALLVNLSYYICQLMVDVSNVLGYQIKNALTQLSSQVSTHHILPTDPQGLDTQTSGGALAILTQSILATAGAVWLFLGITWPMVGLVIITCLIIVVILLLRKAFIVLLVVLSPIAFVAYLLPNTEKYFSKWLNMFWQLLLVFPIVALLLGSGQLASSIILAAGTKGSSSSSYKISGEGCVNLSSSGGSAPTAGAAGSNCNGGPGWMLALVAAGVSIAPMMALYSVLQGALSAAGAIGGKIAGAIQNSAKDPQDKLRKANDDRKKARAERRELRALQNPRGLRNVATFGRATRKASRAARRASVQAETKRAGEAYIADRVQNSTRFQQQMAGAGITGRGADVDALQRVIGRAQFTIEKVEAEEVEAAQAEINRLRLDSSQLEDIRNNGSYRDTQSGQRVGASSNVRRAALQKAVAEQDIGAIEAALQSQNSTPEMRRFIGRSIEKNYQGVKGKAAHLVDNNLLDSLRQGGAVGPTELNTAMNTAMGSMSAELMAGQKGASLARIQANVAAGSTNAAAAISTARTLRGNQQLYDKVGVAERAAIQQIR